MKTCKKCNEEKEFNLFYKNKTTKDGLNLYCKICFNEKRKESYVKNKENTLITSKKWYKNNRNKMILYRKKYEEKNKEKIKEKRKENYLENKEKIIKIRKIYYKENKEYFENYRKIYYKENKEKNNKYSKEYYEINKVKRKEYLKNWRISNKKYSNNYIKQRNKEDKIFKFRNSLRTLICSSFKRGSFNYVKKTKTEFILGCTILEFRNYIESKFTEGMSFQNHGEWHLDHIIPLASATTEEEVIKLNHYTNFQPLWAFDNRSKGCKIL
jgi:hypothetical protein